MLAGAGLGDDPRLAEAPGEQRLAERVVDLVGAGVGEVLALEVEADRGDRVAAARRPAAAPGARPPGDGLARGGRRGRGRRAAGEPASSSSQLRPEPRVVAERVVGRLELLERAHQRLGDVAAAEVALLAPAPGAVDLEQAGVDGRRAGRRRSADGGARRGRASRTGRPGAGPCAGARPGRAGPPCRTRRRRPSRGPRAAPRPTLAGVMPPARVIGTSRATAAASAIVDPDPGPARVRAAGGVEQDRASRRRRGTRGPRPTTPLRVVARARRAAPSMRAGPTAASADGGSSPLQLDRVGVDGRDDLARGAPRSGPR